MDELKKLIIIPAYNESQNIVGVIEDIRKNAPGYDYLVINDCSTDSTLEVLKSNDIPHLNLPVNLGIGGAVQAGYRYAMYNGYDIAIQLDGDGQHKADQLDALVEPFAGGNNVNITIGSRFVKREGFQSSAARRFGISFLSGLIKLCTGVKIYDVTSGFRAVNRDMIRFYAQEYPQDYPEPEAIVYALKRKAKIAEVPVVMSERLAGNSSINFRKSVYYMIKVSFAIILECFRKVNAENTL